jgi:peroxiredoxin
MLLVASRRKNNYFVQSHSNKILKIVTIESAGAEISILAQNRNFIRMKTRIIIFSFIITLFSCSKPGAFEIKGTITNSIDNEIYLDRLEVNGTTPFDSTKIDKRGNFLIKGVITQPTFFLLRLNQQKFLTLLLDSNEHISFSADFINFSSDYMLTGSPGSSKVRDINLHLMKTNLSIDSIQSLIQLHSGNENFRQKQQEWSQQINRIRENQQKYSNKFILDNPFSLASILAIYQKFNNGEYVVQDLQTIKVAASALHSMYPASEHAKTLYEDTKSMMKNEQNYKMQQLINENGTDFPDINLPNPSGREIRLSSIRGKYILIQFWSAFDSNSRMMNPMLKENYQHFSHKGFEIYQVSVDTSRQGWLQAINADQLNWINVGDMKGSRNAVVNYNITSVPSNFLLDRDGKIIASNLFGPALTKKLNEILN